MSGLPKSTIVLVSSLNPSNYGQAVTFSASVTSLSSPAPTGSITFKDTSRSNTLGTITLDANGNARVTTATLRDGAHTITATYSGDTNYASSSASVTQTVNKITPLTTVASSLNPSASGTSVTFTATVSSPAGPPDSGTVQFKDGTTVIGTTTLTSAGGGVTTFTTGALDAGTHSITAHYQGNGAFLSSTSTVLSQTVN